MIMRKLLLLALLISVALLAAKPCFAEEVGTKEDESQNEQELATISTDELERRLDEAEKEIGELELKQDYLKNEEPVYAEYSPSAVERTGFATKDVISSKLLNPTAAMDIEMRLERLYSLKEAIEKELDKRGE